MSEHAPKTAALLAYDSGMLRQSAKARVERHLAACAACRRELASIHAYDALVEDARSAPMPDVDWAKMDLTLRREARDQASRIRADARRPGKRSLALAGAVALAAAAAVVAFVAWPREDGTRADRGRTRVTDTQRSVTPALPGLQGEITAVAGSAFVRRDGRASTAAPGAMIAEGTHLETAEHARLDARLSDETGFVVGPSARVAIDRFRSGEVGLALDHGAITSKVRRLTREARYEVRADPYLVRVRGTHFAVVRESETRAVAVTVDEGVVEVVRDGRVVAVVRAPGVWRSDDSFRGGLALGSLELPRAIGRLETRWPTLRLPRLAHLREWQIAGNRFDAAGDVAMRVPVGELPVLAVDRRGYELYATVMIAEGGAVLDPHALQVRAGYLPTSLIVPVVQNGSAALQGCYNVLLRRRPDIEGRMQRVKLRITVGLTGDVTRVTVRSTEGESILPELSSCITGHAEQWSFPPPTGGPATFEVPYRFSSR